MRRSPQLLPKLSFSLLLGLVALSPAVLRSETSPVTANPSAIAEVQSGKRTEANAAWWGFNADDTTDALQAAIRSGAKKVIVPNLGRDWIVRPLQLVSGQEIFFEPGVVLTAQRGAYRGGGDSVLNADNLTNLVLRGYGATVRMQKEDYIVGKVLKDLGVALVDRLRVVADRAVVAAHVPLARELRRQTQRLGDLRREDNR